MAYTFPEMLDELKLLDEITLLEILELNAEELVDVLIDFIDDNQEKIRKKLELND